MYLEVDQVGPSQEFRPQGCVCKNHTSPLWLRVASCLPACVLSGPFCAALDSQASSSGSLVEESSPQLPNPPGGATLALPQVPATYDILLRCWPTPRPPCCPYRHFEPEYLIHLGDSFSRFPITMQDLLEFFFFALLTTVASLECEICLSNGTHCTGPKKTCPLEKNACMIAYTENTVDGKKEHTIDKDCATANICTSSAIELYFGPGRFMRTVVYCCIENLCKKFESKFPPIETRMNGKQCPACHVWSDTCKEEMVNCTGHNVYCFDVSSHSHAQTNSVDRTMKGCTTKSVCSSIRSGRSPILGNSDLIRRATCIPEVSRGSRCSGFLLPTFSGLLLLLKILV
ncbi:phospholipase A2 inhibitor subunit gamma B-like [Podarcis lilfordi]|uniref:Phospholipase A2 inhibitor subunit gamma B-like n=1 Tax=Podarcis lilfordi TaxID=74358 RepID=A0AA35P9W0_9SAUR|nr:phospholipase A2 inhibitor subunit gamma B-like [Podarcis lilfordi]